MSKLTLDNYNKVLIGENTTKTGKVTGVNPTNQKIYFGDHDEIPL